MKNRIAIIIEDGMLKAVHADDPSIEVAVIDRDGVADDPGTPNNFSEVAQPWADLDAENQKLAEEALGDIHENPEATAELWLDNVRAPDGDVPDITDELIDAVRHSEVEAWRISSPNSEIVLIGREEYHARFRAEIERLGG